MLVILPIAFYSYSSIIVRRFDDSVFRGKGNEELRTKGRRPFLWYEDENGIIHVSHVSIYVQ